MDKRDSSFAWGGLNEVMSERVTATGPWIELRGGNWGEIGGEYRAPAPLYVADNNLSEKQVPFPLSPVAYAARTVETALRAVRVC